MLIWWNENEILICQCFGLFIFSHLVILSDVSNLLFPIYIYIYAHSYKYLYLLSIYLHSTHILFMSLKKYLSMYKYIYVKNFFIVGPKRKNIFNWIDPWRDLYFLENYLFISSLHTWMFPTCCFRQRTYVAQGHGNGALNETQTHLCLWVECLSSFVWVILVC